MEKKEKSKKYSKGDAFIKENLGSAGRINVDGKSEASGYITEEMYQDKLEEEQKVSD